MKTNNSKTELIQRFAESIDKYCTTEQEVASVINAIETMMNFFLDQKRKSRSTILTMLDIKNIVAEYSGEKELRAAEDATDLMTATLIQAECLEKESNLIFEIVTDDKLSELMPN